MTKRRKFFGESASMGNTRASKHAIPFTIQFLKFRSPVDIFSSSITIAFSFIVFREREREREGGGEPYIYVHGTVSRELSKRGFCAISVSVFSPNVDRSEKK